jgi:hypothetical protein
MISPAITVRTIHTLKISNFLKYALRDQRSSYYIISKVLDLIVHDRSGKINLHINIINTL